MSRKAALSIDNTWLCSEESEPVEAILFRLARIDLAQILENTLSGKGEQDNKGKWIAIDEIFNTNLKYSDSAGNFIGYFLKYFSHIFFSLLSFPCYTGNVLLCRS